MQPSNLKDLKKLSKSDKILVLLYIIWQLLRRPALPKPVHFSLVASLTMFALLPIMPHRIIAIPATIGGSISLALILTWITQI